MDQKKINHCNKYKRGSTKFDEKRQLESHMKKHRFRCDKCTKVFYTKLSINRIKCNSCDKKFVLQDKLTMHMETHNDKERSKLENHMKKHTKPKDGVKIEIKEEPVDPSDVALP